MSAAWWVTCDHAEVHETGDECIDADIAAARQGGHAAGYAECQEKVAASQRAHAETVLQMYARGRAEERAAVVFWLSSLSEVAAGLNLGGPRDSAVAGVFSEVAGVVAKALEAGDHVGAAKKEKS